MASFFNGLGKAISSAASNVAEKGKDLAEITKLNGEISKEEKAIQTAFIEIGRLMFEREKDIPDSPAAEFCARIIASEETIEQLKAKIAEVKASSAAPAAPAADSAAPAAKFCPSCGKSCEGASKFCAYCGAPLE